jgi:hypothetical protein
LWLWWWEDWFLGRKISNQLKFKNMSKQDQKLVASKQNYELEYLCRVWIGKDGKHLKISTAKDVVKKIGRSRRAVNVVLRYLGFTYNPRKKK